MWCHRSSLAFLALPLLSPACGGHLARQSSPDAEAAPVSPSASVWVLSESRLALNPDWTVLQAIIGYVPGVRVSDVQSPNTCPTVEIRGKDTIASESNPTVYVDGTRIGDTCVLQSLQAQQVRRVEIYPLGVTRRPGYEANAHGLILIFMKRANG